MDTSVYQIPTKPVSWARQTMKYVHLYTVKYIYIIHWIYNFYTDLPFVQGHTSLTIKTTAEGPPTCVRINM